MPTCRTKFKVAQADTPHRGRGFHFIKRANVLAVVVTAVFAAHGSTWQKTAAGEHSWEEASYWSGSTTPNLDTAANMDWARSMSGDQTITGIGFCKTLVVSNTPVPNVGGQWRTRTFAGNITVADTAIFRTGTNVITGTISVTNDSCLASRVGTHSAQTPLATTLDIYGTFDASGYHGVQVGHAIANNDPSTGRIRLHNGGTFLVNTGETSKTGSSDGLHLARANGASRAASIMAAYVQDGGFAKLGRLFASYETNAASVVTIAGGVLDMPYISDSSRFRVGHKGYAAYQQFGGDVFVNANAPESSASEFSSSAAAYAFEIGSGNDAAALTNAYFYMSGGSFTSGSDFVLSGGAGTAANKKGVAPVHATICGTAAVTSRVVRICGNTGDGNASLNLNGGELCVKWLQSVNNHKGVAEINADGGRIVFPSDARETQFSNINRINVYPGGLTVRCGRDVNLGTVEVPVHLRTPVGRGIVTVSRSSGRVDNSFIPPRIELSGGAGSNAQVVAIVDYELNRATNFVVVCPGEGYAVGDAVTPHVIRKDASNQDLTSNMSATISDSDFAPAVFTKTGSGTMTVYSQPLFDGTYHVRAGCLRQSTSTNGSSAVSAIIVGGPDAALQCGMANATATANNCNPVNPAATLTLGTADGPGTLRIPSAANGSSAFLQAFASLSVNGTGNKIVLAAGNDVVNGASVTFGSVTFADGAELTIPRDVRNFKVFVTGASPGTFFANVKFDGTSKTAYVAADGQLLPVPTGIVISIH